MKPLPPEDNEHAPDPVHLWTAYGVSAAAAFHLVAAALVLLHHSR
ncbi:hypothetical protein [Kitasatospora sp. NPDC101183]